MALKEEVDRLAQPPSGFGVFLEATETVELTVVQQVMREMGAKGGKIGGKRRLETMTDEQRRRSARRAAKAFWAKVKKAQ